MIYKKIKYAILLTLFLFPVSYTNAQRYTFNQITVEDGLSQSTITNIIQDKEGYMWFGTGNGLNKYNGYTFVIYSAIMDDPSSISSNGITSLFEDSGGVLWIGTADGILNRFNRNLETFDRFSITDGLKVVQEKEEYFDFPLAYSRNNINSLTSIVEDNDGNLWIGTWGKGIIKFNPEKRTIEHFFAGKDIKNSLSSNKITQIIKSSDGSLWISTMGGGLNRLTSSANKIKFNTFKNSVSDPGSIGDNYINSVYEDSKKNLWISTYTHGLNKISLSDAVTGNAQFYKYRHVSGKNSLASDNVMSVIEDSEGYIWIATFRGGLDRLNPEKDEFLNFRKNPLNDNSIADDDVLTMYEDNSGIIWIGTHLGRGISKLEKNKIKFNHIKKDQPGKSLNDNVVWSILKDDENTWIGTYKGGLNKIDKQGNFRYYTARGSGSHISDDHIRSIAKDFNGNLWIGTYSGGLNKFNPATEKFNTYLNDPDNLNSIGANQVLSILVAPDSVFWIATFGGGLNYFKYTGSDNIKFKRFTNIPSDSTSLSNDRVYSIYQTRDGVIWAGTFGGGLARLDKKSGKFKRYVNNPNDPSSLSHNRVMSIYEDNGGLMWISTYGGGLNSFERKTGTFKHYGRKQGLSSDVIYGVLEDNSGNLWISSDNGLFKYYTAMNRFIHYDLDDGIQSREFSGGAYFKSKDGTLLFGGINGFNYFHPDSIYENQNIPHVVVSSIKISGEPYKGETDELELNYYENFITFEFAALDFTNPVDNQYEYILEGLESDWQSTSSKYRVANYTNLSSGTYYFKVKGSNNDEIWNTQPTVIKITILHPFWQTWWFILLVIVVAGMLIYFGSTIRIRNLLAIEKLKTKLAADLHDNIGAGLTEISILSELAANDRNNNSDQFSAKLKNISETARQLIDNMSDIVWVVNPKRDSLNDLIIRLNDAYAELLSGLGISLRTYNLEKLENIKLSMDYKQNLFMILKEGINNSIKHSRCKKIILEANMRNDIIEIIIKDDGIGLDVSNIEYGNGLKNIKSRAESVGGKVKWKRRKNGGTALVFIGRVNRQKNLWEKLKKQKEQN